MAGILSGYCSLPVVSPIYRYLNREAQEAAAVHEANYLIFNCDGSKVVILTIDAFYSSKALESMISKELTNRFKTEFTVITIASHSHSSPVLDKEKNKLCPQNDLYLNEVAETLIYNLCITLGYEFNTISLIKRYQISLDGIVSNRRKKAFYLGFKPPYVGLKAQFRHKNVATDLFFDKQIFYNGDKIACVWLNVPCHPVCYPNDLQIHPDYIHFLRDECRRLYGDIPILFSLGACGDLRPAIISRGEYVKTTQSLYHKWITKLMVQFEGQFAIEHTEENPKCSMSFATLPMKHLITDYEGKVSQLEFYILKIGKSTRIITNAELGHDYEQIFKTELNLPNLVVDTCAGSCPGYLMPDKELSTRGYEVYDFMKWFEMKGKWKADKDNTLLQAIRRKLNA